MPLLLHTAAAVAVLLRNERGALPIDPVAADVLVAGSYIFRAGDAAEAVAALREAFPPETSPQGKRWPWQR